MARPVKLPANVAKLIKEIKNLEYSLDKRDKLGWAGVERSNMPDASMERVIDKFEKLKKWEKNGIITGPQYKKAVSQLEDIMPSLQRRVAQMGVVDGDMFPLRQAAPSAHVPKPNAYFDQAKAGKRPVRNISIADGDYTLPQSRQDLGGLGGPKAARSVPGIIPQAPPVQSSIPSTTGVVPPSKNLPTFALGQESPAPPPLRAQAGTPLTMIPDGRPMGTDAINMDATKEYDPRLKRMVGAGYGGTALTKLPSGEPTQFAIDEGRVGRSTSAAKQKPEPENMGPWQKRGSHMMRLRKGLENFDIAKAGKVGGKVAKGGLLGLPLLALDYMAPNNAIAASRNEGYGMLDDMGLDVQGGIDSIENPWARGGASLLDGLLIDPVMTAVGGAKKFKEMIQDDIAESKRLKKKRKESGWKPKAYRGGILANGD